MTCVNDDGAIAECIPIGEKVDFSQALHFLGLALFVYILSILLNKYIYNPPELFLFLVLL